MKRWVLVCALMLGACDCGGGNNGGPDAGSDVGSNNGAEDAGVDSGSDLADPDTPPDMPEDPEGFFIEGLSAPVTARFDEWGVLHLECQTDADCAAAQGYFHAAHRFSQMDLQRRVATGRVATLVGNLALDFDESMRLLLSTREGTPLAEAMWEAADGDVKEMITAYTAGVNAWLADLDRSRNGAKLSDEYEFELIQTDVIPPWTETDSIAAALLLLERLSNQSSYDILRAEAAVNLTPDQAFDILGVMSATQVATVPASGETHPSTMLQRFPDVGQLGLALERLRDSREILGKARERLEALYAFRGEHRRHNGSNNWVVAGSNTASGKPLLANDPHLDLSNPTLWYLVEIDSKTNGSGSYHMTGASFPGIPGILIGHNDSVAWGVTTAFLDLSDVYVEELNADGSAVMFNGQEVPILEIEVSFEVARSAPVTRTLRYVPHHGPIIAYDAAGGEAVSLRWTGNDARTDVNAFFRLGKATNVDEARAAIEQATSTNQNFVVADLSGDIAWYPYSALHERPWASLALPPWMPLPGDGTAEWGDPVAYADLPQMRNPAAGFIATANNDMTGATFDGDPTNEPYPYLQDSGEIAGFRIERIVEVLNQSTQHTAQSMQDLQYDTYIGFRDFILPAVRAVVEADPTALSADATTLWSTLDTWDGTCPTGLAGHEPDAAKSTDAAESAASIGCFAFHTLQVALAEAAFVDELGEADITELEIGLEVLRTSAILLDDPTRLRGGESYWDDVSTPAVETKEEMIRKSLDDAFAALVEITGSPTPDDWRWGAHHVVLLPASLLSDAGVKKFNAGPFAAPGGSLSVNVANPESAFVNDYEYIHAASMRQVAEVTDDGIVSYWALPGGQRHFRDSPHYLDLMDEWLEGDFFRMPFTPQEVEAAAVETIVITPR